MEAMYWGCPIAASNIASLVELFAPLGNRMKYFDPSDAQDLVRVLKEFETNREAILSQQQAARHLISVGLGRMQPPTGWKSYRTPSRWQARNMLVLRLLPARHSLVKPTIGDKDAQCHFMRLSLDRVRSLTPVVGNGTQRLCLHPRIAVPYSSLIEFCKKTKTPFCLENVSKVAIPFTPDCVASIYYRNIIKKPIIEACDGRIFNLHPSLLPRYRGCSSLTWAMIEAKRRRVHISLH